MDWQTFFFDQQAQWPDRLMQVARRRFVDPVLAEEAYTAAFDRLVADNWSALGTYTGKSNPGSYLVTVFSNLLEDFSRSRFGRVRPPAWLSRLGSLWKRVFELLCLERREPETVVDHVSARETLDADEVRRMIREIRAGVPSCGERTGAFAEEGGMAEIDSTSTAQDAPETTLDRADVHQLLSVLGSLLDDQRRPDASGDAAADAGDYWQRWSTLRKRIQLDAEERLVLRMVYQDGVKVARAARAINQPEHQVRRMLKRTLAKLRQRLEEAGLSASELRSLPDGAKSAHVN